MIKEKELLLKEVQGQIDKFGTFLIMRYSKLSANRANEFRRAVIGLGGDVEVLRKRMLRKAAEAAEIDLAAIDLDGHIGLVYGGRDTLETAKYVYKFSRDHNKSIEVIGGLYEGRTYNSSEMEMLSQLPSKDDMRAELLSTFEAPLAQTLAVFDALLTSLPHCFENKISMKSEEADAEG